MNDHWPGQLVRNLDRKKTERSDTRSLVELCEWICGTGHKGKIFPFIAFIPFISIMEEALHNEVAFFSQLSSVTVLELR